MRIIVARPGLRWHLKLVRTLAVILGDQLNEDSAIFEGFDPQQDAVWMAEVTGESQHVPSHKARTVLFLSAMRHFRDRLRARGLTVIYQELQPGSLRGLLERDIKQHAPQQVLCVWPGDFRVKEALAPHVHRFLEDRHFLATPDEFRQHAQGRKQLRLEYFYRAMRRRYGVLMEGDQPLGGSWNYDAENRESLPAGGPVGLIEPLRFPPDLTTQVVMAAVGQQLPGNPGSLASFSWPVTREQGLAVLADFVEHRLPLFGRYQDAMWTGEPWLYHSLLSAALNLKLLDPREVLAAVEHAAAPLAAREGFIRQILGWREYVRGLYWLKMPGYAELNALHAQEALPEFYWTGDTPMVCLREAIGQTLKHGYAHHIQRLMVTGLYAMLLGVAPRAIHEWYLAVYVDAVEWVELPNVIGMSQFADGGIMASKPYAASGKYIDRMSNYCGGCRFDPAQSTGPRACPFTTLYWDFLMRHEHALRKVPRMEMQLRNLARLKPEQKKAIAEQAAVIQEAGCPTTSSLEPAAASAPPLFNAL
ncbi:MAG: cryptochrome/photolyase family protein [Acidobacteria bacterium]|nr:cryptochrome/photolyase family protein [Acidobacteriota bacterium]